MVGLDEGGAAARLRHKDEEPKDKEGTYVRRERYTGEVTRAVALPMPIDPDKVTATYEHGVLMLKVPKPSKAQPKQIPVQMTDKIEAPTR